MSIFISKNGGGTCFKYQIIYVMSLTELLKLLWRGRTRKNIVLYIYTLNFQLQQTQASDRENELKFKLQLHGKE